MTTPPNTPTGPTPLLPFHARRSIGTPMPPAPALRAPVGGRSRALHRAPAALFPVLLAGLLLAAPVVASPNFLVVLADALGIEHVGSYGIGAEPAPTPTLDRLAAEGRLFLHAWSSPVCSPTRAGLQTGRFALRTGVGSAVQSDADPGLALTETTLAELLPDHATGFFGKWHLGTGEAEGGNEAPLQQGYDFALWLARNLYSSGQGYYDYTLRRGTLEEHHTTFLTTLLTDEAVAWISGQVGPWAALVMYQAPHGPYECPPPELVGCDPQGGTVEIYQAMITALDSEVGRLLDSVDTTDTLVLFLSDNGSPGGTALPPVTSNRAKHTGFQGGVRVPFVAWGGMVEPGSVEQPVMVQDIFPTLAELASVETPAVDGRSLAHLLTGCGCGPHHEFVYTEQFGTDGTTPTWRAVRDVAGYKLLGRDGHLGMVHLPTDPWEGDNLLPDLTSGEQEAYDAMAAWVASLMDGP